MFLNRVLLYGNLTRDPELKALPSGGNVATFGLATNRTYKDKNGQKQEASEFHNIVAFGRVAEIIAQYAKKGRPLFIEGRLQTRTWDDRESGKKQYRTEIVAENFQFGSDGGRGGSGNGGSVRTLNEENGPSASSGQAADIQYPDEEINPEDIPF